jgi:hypothetical protein
MVRESALRAHEGHFYVSKTQWGLPTAQLLVRVFLTRERVNPVLVQAVYQRRNEAFFAAVQLNQELVER